MWKLKYWKAVHVCYWYCSTFSNTVIIQSFAWRSLFCVFVFSTPNFKRSRQIIKDKCCENSWDQNGKQFVLTKIEIQKSFVWGKGWTPVKPCRVALQGRPTWGWRTSPSWRRSEKEPTESSTKAKTRERESWWLIISFLLI